MKRKHPPVLALHATSKGFGFVVMSGPFSLVDWGTRQAISDKNAASLKALTRLIDRFDPHSVILEDPTQLSRRSPRISRLYQAIAALCHGRSIDLAVVSRADIFRCYATVGARTWQDVAEAVAHQLEPLRALIPTRRKAWQSESAHGDLCRDGRCDELLADGRRFHCVRALKRQIDNHRRMQAGRLTKRLARG